MQVALIRADLLPIYCRTLLAREFPRRVAVKGLEVRVSMQIPLRLAHDSVNMLTQSRAAEERSAAAATQQKSIRTMFSR